MEEWKFDFEYLRAQNYVKRQLNQSELPNLNAILFLIGIQELGRWKNAFTKEEKQDLMHIAVCRLLSIEGVFEFKGRDQDGWPHWTQIKPIPQNGVKDQERLLKELVITYFRGLKSEQKDLFKTSPNDEEE